LSFHTNALYDVISSRISEIFSDIVTVPYPASEVCTTAFETVSQATDTSSFFELYNAIKHLMLPASASSTPLQLKLAPSSAGEILENPFQILIYLYSTIFRTSSNFILITPIHSSAAP